MLRRIIKYLMALLVPLWLAFHILILFNMPENYSRAVTYSIFILATSFLVALTTNTTRYNLILALLTYGP